MTSLATDLRKSIALDDAVKDLKPGDWVRFKGHPFVQIIAKVFPDGTFETEGKIQYLHPERIVEVRRLA